MELGITLVIMANEVSMMWEYLFDAEGSRVCTRRVNALVIDELTAVKFILYADTNMIKPVSYTHLTLPTKRIV